MGMRLDSTDEDIQVSFPPIDSIPDGPEDKPTPGPLLVCVVLSDIESESELGEDHFSCAIHRKKPSNRSIYLS
jgi:hypothetical protein